MEVRLSRFDKRGGKGIDKGGGKGIDKGISKGTDKGTDNGVDKGVVQPLLNSIINEVNDINEVNVLNAYGAVSENQIVSTLGAPRNAGEYQDRNGNHRRARAVLSGLCMPFR
jgi:tRNA A-37 threonylcarbamoyl transferase component Bud32